MPAINDMNDEIYEQAHTVLNDLPEQPTVVEQGIALSVQREFLEYAEGIDLNQYSQEDIRARGRSLFDPDTTLEDKKKALVLLAHSGTVEFYRVIERYVKTAEGELKNWGTLALEECRMYLEGSLLDKRVGMVMTGLGGKDNKLRYFLVVRARKGVAFTDPQETVIELSFKQVGERLESVLERIEFHQTHVTMIVLIPLNIAVAEFIEGGIRAGNQVDGLLDVDYYVRNDRIPTEEKVLHWVQGEEDRAG